MNRTVAATAVAATALLTLTGCFRMELDLDVGADDLVSGTLVAGMDAATAEALTEMFTEMGEEMSEGMGGEADPELEADLEAQMEAELGSPDALAEDIVATLEENGADTAVTEYAEDGFEGVEVSFDGLPMDAVGDAVGGTSEGDTLAITGDGDTYDVKIVMDLTDESTSPGETGETGDMGLGDMGLGDMGLGDMREPEGRIAVTLPGVVTQTNGDVDGTTVAWDLAFGEVNELTASAALEPADAAPTEASSDEGSDVAVVAAVGGGVALLALLGGLLLVRSRRRDRAQA
ncbi:hypothetical protein [Nocardioides sp. zg-DK7169]|uniref:LppM family (lipo)protein n=1 Tax=Nocardioides sp. zg-DK7169 TaxID=2736600 RepID=UPI0015526FC6|nr:hypothetical protein [Nocardioides sp. zg-DK7169]NPC99102.1 hypothetical protein [Nocardioides sp. zg-DK7169]